MREIKLRYTYKHRETGKIGINFSTVTNIEGEDSWQGATPWELIGRDEYTGLKDKNGREIYEGDIVLLSGNIPSLDDYEVPYNFKIVFQRGYFGVTQDDFQFEPLFVYSNFAEVIGNIYENPDLLPDSPDRVQPDGGAEG